VTDYFNALDETLSEELSVTISSKDKWKMRKPHPFWRLDVMGAAQRQFLWQELPEGERLRISDELGPRKEKKT